MGKKEYLAIENDVHWHQSSALLQTPRVSPHISDISVQCSPHSGHLLAQAAGHKMLLFPVHFVYKSE